ncbi:unnamed protein product [Phaedon cochleariae]|uniref:Sulfhydryl oxidase n=1 Tax=Phaedon cochleariae TaxID=80249 RepID=A0A9N9SAV4_PHACE|nr:unnamed protein product [Phaedon cochleariae]
MGHNINIIVLLLFGLVNLSINAVIKNNRTYYPEGLYSPEDDVQILTVINFDATIYGSEKAWMVEFYSNWCGYCQRAAPVFKEFATDIKGWSDVVGVGALDCANDVNTPICTYFEVTKYPTFKYFHENYEEGPTNLGLRIIADSHTNVSEHRKNLVDILESEQFNGRGQIFPNLRPFNETELNKLFNIPSPNLTYAFLIIQESTDDIGPSITMDFHNVDSAVVRYSYVNDTFLKKDLFPALYVIEKDSGLQFLSIPSPSREGFKKTIVEYLTSKNVTLPEEHSYRNNSQFEIQETTSQNDTLLRQKIKAMGDVVFQGDLESSLRYSLKHEVGGAKEISGEKLKSLRAYIDVLVKYFPFSTNGKSLLNQIRTYAYSRDHIDGTEIRKLVVDADKPGKHVFSSPQQWLACRASGSAHRGYPCSLWKMFHYLTINAANAESGVKDSNPRVVLEAMYGYIKNFFSCEDCANHFVEMAGRREFYKVPSWNESILWLWRAHNEVNKRLSGDETEDPEYPKIQFPSKAYCPQCYRADDSWNEAEVLVYLKKMYSYENIRYMGSDPQVLHFDKMPMPSSSKNLKALGTNIPLVMAGMLVSFGLRGE